jgi:signal transduction histidine kinase
MLAGNLYKSTAVRLAAIYIALFSVAHSAATISAYQMVLRFLDTRLDANVTERYREISSAYEARGLGGAIQMIESHGPAIEGEETLYTLRGPAGEQIAGNASLAQVPLGFSVLFPKDQQANTYHYKVFRGRLGEFDLTVGISYGDTDHLAGAVLTSFGWATVIIMTVGMSGAAFLAYRTRQRILDLSRAAHQIGHGELAKRLPVSSRMDDIDVLSSEVNVALQRLEASVTGMKQITTNIAHDLKTPIGRTFLLLDDILACERLDEAKHGVSSALAELKTIADTFDALLRIAQIEARNRSINFREFDLRPLISELYEIYEPIAADGGYEIALQVVENGAYSVEGDPDLIRQMIVNLLTNSLRHTPSGSRITIELSRRLAHIEVCVSDDGSGIPQDEHDKVFDRFYRLDKSRTTPGSGLGLAMVKAIAELHGTKPRLQDNGPGLKVVIELPIAVPR